ncbi:NUDIX hydrolase [Sphingomonas jatrophae]|uniref:NUDIX domain-containing protein n=1 Tax=Sphingomonas jatrophae TaxID=1166337 RepID=A0A1I6LLS3_9SPHN|nr:NUDIX domain-containing protein [Sphingomonas jatrophae]SFS04424.1 NUDIX domain-containing protein [Sphingomonas jatrophae]
MMESVPAATLILWRDGPPAEILMVERAATMAFAAGAMVFPGGRVDPGDHALAAGADDPGDAAARIAAIRETIEETGIAVGLDPVPGAADLAHMRAALADGAGFAALLEAGGYRLMLDRLVPFARWCPPAGAETRRFDTRFYVADAPAETRALADGSETTAVRWTTPADVLADAEAGRCHLIFPTLRNLERLAGLTDLAALRGHAAAHPVRMIEPFVETDAEGGWLCIPDDVGYPVTRQRLSDVRRG